MYCGGITYSIVHDADLAAGHGPHPAASPFDKRVSEILKLSAFELYKVELPAGASTVPHDHLHDGVEDAYSIIRGGGWLVVDGTEIPITAGHFIAVTKESTRFVKAGSNGCDLIAVCA